MQAKPYEVWAQERAAAEAQADRRMREAAMGSQALGQGLSSLQPQRPTVHQPTHDFDRSAMFAAERAAGLEKMNRAAELNRQNEEYSIRLRLKYAPKKAAGGPGPVSKLVQEYFKLRDEVPQDETQANRKRERMKYIELQLPRYGRGGQQAMTDLQQLGISAESYKAAGKHEMGAALEKQKEMMRSQAAAAAAQQRADLAEYNVESRLSAPPKDGAFASQDEIDRTREASKRAKEALMRARRVKVNGSEYTVED